VNQILVILGVAIVAFGIVLAIGFVISGGRTSQEKAVKRAQTIVGTSGRDAARRLRTQPANSAESRRKQIVKSLQDQEKRQKKARLNLRNKLYQAGLNFTVPQFWMGSAAMGVVVLLMLLVMRVNPLVALGLGAASALGLPQWILGFLAKRRTNKFTAVFSDAMDIIVRGIKSGLPVHDCLKIIGRETAQPLAGEFTRLVENIGMGVTLDQALDKLHERMPTAEVRFFSIVMNIQQKTGGNLAEALNNLSAVLRSRKLMKEKVKALSAEATSSAMIIGALPPGVVVLIMLWTPAYMSPMFTDHRGWLMLGGSAIWMSLGVFVMVRMINFKF
jgi:tight adherence protein B